MQYLVTYPITHANVSILLTAVVAGFHAVAETLKFAEISSQSYKIAHRRITRSWRWWPGAIFLVVLFALNVKPQLLVSEPQAFLPLV